MAIGTDAGRLNVLPVIVFSRTLEKVEMAELEAG
jgi:hypothetical protein